MAYANSGSDVFVLFEDDDELTVIEASSAPAAASASASAAATAAPLDAVTVPGAVVKLFDDDDDVDVEEMAEDPLEASNPLSFDHLAAEDQLQRLLYMTDESSAKRELEIAQCSQKINELEDLITKATRENQANLLFREYIASLGAQETPAEYRKHVEALDKMRKDLRKLMDKKRLLVRTVRTAADNTRRMLRAVHVATPTPMDTGTADDADGDYAPSSSDSESDEVQSSEDEDNPMHGPSDDEDIRTAQNVADLQDATEDTVDEHTTLDEHLEAVLARLDAVHTRASITDFGTPVEDPYIDNQGRHNLLADPTFTEIWEMLWKICRTESWRVTGGGRTCVAEILYRAIPPRGQLKDCTWLHFLHSGYDVAHGLVSLFGEHAAKISGIKPNRAGSIVPKAVRSRTERDSMTAWRTGVDIEAHRLAPNDVTAALPVDQTYKMQGDPIFQIMSPFLSDFLSQMVGTKGEPASREEMMAAMSQETSIGSNRGPTFYPLSCISDGDAPEPLGVRLQVKTECSSTEGCILNNTSVKDSTLPVTFDVGVAVLMLPYFSEAFPESAMTADEFLWYLYNSTEPILGHMARLAFPTSLPALRGFHDDVWAALRYLRYDEEAFKRDKVRHHVYRAYEKRMQLGAKMTIPYICAIRDASTLADILRGDSARNMLLPKKSYRPDRFKSVVGDGKFFEMLQTGFTEKRPLTLQTIVDVITAYNGVDYSSPNGQFSVLENRLKRLIAVMPPDTYMESLGVTWWDFITLNCVVPMRATGDTESTYVRFTANLTPLLPTKVNAKIESLEKVARQDQWMVCGPIDIRIGLLLMPLFHPNLLMRRIPTPKLFQACSFPPFEDLLRIAAQFMLPIDAWRNVFVGRFHSAPQYDFEQLGDLANDYVPGPMRDTFHSLVRWLYSQSICFFEPLRAPEQQARPLSEACKDARFDLANPSSAQTQFVLANAQVTWDACFLGAAVTSITRLSAFLQQVQSACAQLRTQTGTPFLNLTSARKLSAAAAAAAAAAEADADDDDDVNNTALDDDEGTAAAADYRYKARWLYYHIGYFQKIYQQSSLITDASLLEYIEARNPENDVQWSFLRDPTVAAALYPFFFATHADPNKKNTSPLTPILDVVRQLLKTHCFTASVEDDTEFIKYVYNTQKLTSREIPESVLWLTVVTRTNGKGPRTFKDLTCLSTPRLKVHTIAPINNNAYNTIVVATASADPAAFVQAFVTEMAKQLDTSALMAYSQMVMGVSVQSTCQPSQYQYSNTSANFLEAMLKTDSFTLTLRGAIIYDMFRRGTLEDPVEVGLPNDDDLAAFTARQRQLVRNAITDARSMGIVIGRLGGDKSMFNICPRPYTAWCTVLHDIVATHTETVPPEIKSATKLLIRSTVLTRDAAARVEAARLLPSAQPVRLVKEDYENTLETGNVLLDKLYLQNFERTVGPLTYTAFVRGFDSLRVSEIVFPTRPSITVLPHWMGLIVGPVLEDSIAAKNGVQAGMIITLINGRPVVGMTPPQLKSMFSNLGKDSIRLTVHDPTVLCRPVPPKKKKKSDQSSEEEVGAKYAVPVFWQQLFRASFFFKQFSPQSGPIDLEGWNPALVFALQEMYPNEMGLLAATVDFSAHTQAIEEVGLEFEFLQLYGVVRADEGLQFPPVVDKTAAAAAAATSTAVWSGDEKPKKITPRGCMQPFEFHQMATKGDLGTLFQYTRIHHGMAKIWNTFEGDTHNWFVYLQNMHTAMNEKYRDESDAKATYKREITVRAAVLATYTGNLFPPKALADRDKTGLRWEEISSFIAIYYPALASFLLLTRKHALPSGTEAVWKEPIALYVATPDSAHSDFHRVSAMIGLGDTDSIPALNDADRLTRDLVQSIVKQYVQRATILVQSYDTEDSLFTNLTQAKLVDLLATTTDSGIILNLFRAHYRLDLANDAQVMTIQGDAPVNEGGDIRTASWAHFAFTYANQFPRWDIIRMMPLFKYTFTVHDIRTISDKIKDSKGDNITKFWIYAAIVACSRLPAKPAPFSDMLTYMHTQIPAKTNASAAAVKYIRRSVPIDQESNGYTLWGVFCIHVEEELKAIKEAMPSFAPRSGTVVLRDDQVRDPAAAVTVLWSDDIDATDPRTLTTAFESYMLNLFIGTALPRDTTAKENVDAVTPRENVGAFQTLTRFIPVFGKGATVTVLPPPAAGSGLRASVSGSVQPIQQASNADWQNFSLGEEELPPQQPPQQHQSRTHQPQGPRYRGPADEIRPEPQPNDLPHIQLSHEQEVADLKQKLAAATQPTNPTPAPKRKRDKAAAAKEEEEKKQAAKLPRPGPDTRIVDDVYKSPKPPPPPAAARVPGKGAAGGDDSAMYAHVPPKRFFEE